MAPKFRCITDTGARLLIEAASAAEARQIAERRGHKGVEIISKDHSSQPGGQNAQDNEVTDSGSGTGQTAEQPYQNLRVLGTTMVHFGQMVQTAAKVIAILGALVALIPPMADTARILVLFAGLVMGLAFYGAGMCITALGEALQALADIAVHTSRIPAQED